MKTLFEEIFESKPTVSIENWLLDCEREFEEAYNNYEEYSCFVEWLDYEHETELNSSKFCDGRGCRECPFSIMNIGNKFILDYFRFDDGTYKTVRGNKIINKE